MNSVCHGTVPLIDLSPEQTPTAEQTPRTDTDCKRTLNPVNLRWFQFRVVASICKVPVFDLNPRREHGKSHIELWQCFQNWHSREFDVQSQAHNSARRIREEASQL